MNLIDGRKISQKILKGVKEEVKAEDLSPWLAVVLVGSDPASSVYVRLKEKKAQEVGIRIRKYVLPDDTSDSELLKIVDVLNRDSKINGILVQLPLPENLTTDKIINGIKKEKDVDGFLKESRFEPPFILGIEKAIKETGLSLKNKKIMALVNSEVFGEKLQSFFKNRNLDLEYILRKKGNLENLKQADILITACGKPELIDVSFVKDGVILIDGGISKTNGRIEGDINRQSVAAKTKWLTPVPGGLGPLTIAFLLKNVVEACKESRL
jgi:methylenetetrahydrofolate dehydrogenase (NADP+)/methenyltetrahydrofolate cyclohydrolase